LLAGLETAATAAEATGKQSMQFEEVFNLLREQMAGFKDADLSRAAAEGLIEKLSPRVTLVGGASAAGSTNTEPVQARVFDGAFGYVRVGRLVAGVEKEFNTVVDGLRSTNRLKGLVLDLRYATGLDYGAAVGIADKFFGSEQPLVDWGEGLKKSTDKPKAIAGPVAVLVNAGTRGAAEALAAILRHTDIALLIGADTAGQAAMAKEFTLKTGQRLRIAVAPLKVGDGKELPLGGLKPDIAIEVNPENERQWFEDAFKVLPRAGATASVATNEAVTIASATNRPPRRRLNEAELVRMNREGRDMDTNNATARQPEPALPVVNDPALARALDLLKGLSVVQQFRPS
jgi:Peptidase family S41